MKMTLKRANWACLLAFVLIFAACKKEKEEEVVPEPIVGVTVENGNADVTIDQQEKRIDVTFYAYCDLSEVLVSFDLIEGAQMFIPYLKDTVYMDLSKEKGATVAARVDGQTVVYTMFATIEYALAGVQVKAEDVDGEVTLYREDRVVRVVFDRPVDLSRVDVTFLLGASGTLVDPQSNPVTMDLTEPARFTVASERARGRPSIRSRPKSIWGSSFPTGGRRSRITNCRITCVFIVPTICRGPRLMLWWPIRMPCLR